MGTGGPAAGIAKPLATSRKVATDHASRVVNSTIHARPFGQHFVDLINVFFHELVLKVELVLQKLMEVRQRKTHALHVCGWQQSLWNVMVHCTHVALLMRKLSRLPSRK